MNNMFDGKKCRIKKGYIYFGNKILHREVWKKFNGEIPAHHVIHHKDGNKLNNSIENLECLNQAAHSFLHAKERREELSKCMKNNSGKIHAWLKTEKGKNFLSEKKKREWLELPERTFICEFCKKEFKTKHNRKQVKFCGDACVMRARVASGIDNVERACIICSNLFTINKYQKTVTCSKPCRAKHIGNLKRKN